MGRPKVLKTASGRRYCRFCSGLAGFTRDVCDGCRGADISVKLRDAAAPPIPKPKHIQEAYARSVEEIPNVAVRGVSGFVLAGAAQGVARPTLDILVHAQQFGATLGVVADAAEAAERYFTENKRVFYDRIRRMLRSLDYKKRVRIKPSDKGRGERDRSAKRAKLPENIALGHALRTARIFLRREIIPMAMEIGCSKAAIWHVETGHNVVQARWVAKYANVLEVDESALWTYAGALMDAPEMHDDPRALMRLFAVHVLAVDPAACPPPKSESLAAIYALSGANYHKPRVVTRPTRKHPGTGNASNKALGQALRYCRVSKGMTASEMAATAPMGLTHVYNLESDIKRIGPHQVERYARVLNVPAEVIWLFSDVLYENGANADPGWLAEQFEKILQSRS